jgi:hypothetical protein
LAEWQASIDADLAIELLNEFLARDPAAISGLFRHRVRCNSELAVCPGVQVGHGPCAAEERFGETGLAAGQFNVGILGVLNGLFGADDRGLGLITACYDADGAVGCFMRTP